MVDKMNDENFRKYLEIIQGVIERMAKNSFQIKAWAATLFTATIVLTYSVINILIFLVLILAITMLWTLDAYYLKQERLFRKLYGKVVEDYNDPSKKDNIKLFDMSVKEFEDNVDDVSKIMFSISEGLYYLAFIIVLIIFLITYFTIGWQVLISGSS